DVTPAAVLPVEDGGDVSDDALIAKAPVVRLVEVPADVHAAGNLSEWRAESEQHDISARLQIEHSARAALAPHRLFRGGVVKERRHGKLLDASTESHAEPVQNFAGVVHTG